MSMKKPKKRRVQNLKQKFRESNEWKEFRLKMAKVFNGKDFLTGSKLAKGFNLHHMRTQLDENQYCDISNQDEFLPLNSYSHKFIHYLFTYYKKDKTVIDRLVQVLEKMLALSSEENQIKPQVQNN